MSDSAGLDEPGAIRKLFRVVPQLIVRNRRRSLATLKREFPGAAILDVTSRGPEPWVRFSPFFPHGDIPVPFTPNRRACSVEGVWQALKVFESVDVDESKLDVTSMKGLKRTVRKFGRCLGHREGLDGERLLGYLEARQRIYLPTYRWVLAEKLAKEVAALRDELQQRDAVLLDYETNGDIHDLSKPLSHAALVIQLILQGEVASVQSECTA